MTDKKLYKSKKDKKLAGVCGGLGEFLGLDSSIVRIIWALLILCAGTGLLLYIICALVLPEKPDDIIDV